MEFVGASSSSECNLGILETLSEDAIEEITESYDGLFATVESLIAGNRDSSVEQELVSHVSTLCKYGLASLVRDHFLTSLQEAFDKGGASSFWLHFDDFRHKKHTDYGQEIHQALCEALEEISIEKQFHDKCLSILLHALHSSQATQDNSDAQRVQLFSRFRSMLSSTLMTTLPPHFPEILHWYFKEKLEELSAIMNEDDTQQLLETDGMDLDDKLRSKNGDMDVDEGFSRHDELVKNIGKVVRDLRSIGFTSMAENAYASAIFLLLKAKVHDLAGDDYRTSVLGSIKEWIQTVPLQFLNALLSYLGDSVRYDHTTQPSALTSPLACCPSSPSFSKVSTPSEGIVRWKLRLEYFAYETLQDLRIAKLFEIIVDYPESSPAIEDLKQCLEYTGQHSKLVESFISSLKYRLLTAGASTNDILHQYVSTIKALRAIDPAGVFLEAVGEPIRDYLRGRKDTIKCVVTMLTDGGSSGGGNAANGSGGNAGDSLLEELMRDEESQENVGFDDDFHIDDKQAWINASRWEPDPVEADPLKGSLSQRKVDILGMLVDIIGSKEQLVNEYRVMLAEKLLNKTDYDIDTEIRTVELLKIHFGEASMQRCEIMLNDLIDSKRVNTNIKKASQTGTELGESELSVDILTSTILSTNFWPPIQEEALVLPGPIDKLLSDYANRYHEIKTPRKLLWKKNLGTVKLELEFEDRAMEFTVSPTHAAIIMQFQEKKSWNSIDLAAATGIPIDVLNRRVNLWISKGVLRETRGRDSTNGNVYTLVESMTDSSGKNESEELLGGDEESERSIASVEDQLRKEMTIYEKFIMGMLTNFGSMALERIHNTLKMFCVADPSYDKSLQQLQSFLSGLVSEEKLEFRDGMYLLKK